MARRSWRRRLAVATLAALGVLAVAAGYHLQALVRARILDVL